MINFKDRWGLSKKEVVQQKGFKKESLTVSSPISKMVMNNISQFFPKIISFIDPRQHYIQSLTCLISLICNDTTSTLS